MPPTRCVLAALASRGIVARRVSCANAASRRRRARAVSGGNRLARARCAEAGCVRPPASKRVLERNALRSRFGIRRGAALLGFDNLTINPRDVAARLLIRAADLGARLFAPVDIVDIRRSRSSVVATGRDGAQIGAAGYLVLASGYEFPRIVPKQGHHITTTWAFATVPQRRRLWPEECLIWEASTPYLYARTTADGRVLCGGEDAPGSVADHGEAEWRARSRPCSARSESCFPDSTPTPRIQLGGFVRRDRHRTSHDRRDTGSQELLGRARLWRQRHHLQPDRRGDHSHRADRRRRSRCRSLRVQDVMRFDGTSSPRARWSS